MKNLHAVAIEMFQNNELALRKLVMGWESYTTEPYHAVMKNYMNNKLKPEQYWTVIKHLYTFLDCFIMDDNIHPDDPTPPLTMEEKEYWFYFNQMKNASEYLAD